MLRAFASRWMRSATLRAGICACVASIVGAASPATAATVTNVTPGGAASSITGGTAGSPISCFGGGPVGCLLFVVSGSGNVTFQPNVFPLTETFAFGSASVTNVGPGIDPSLQASVNVDNASTGGATAVTASILYAFAVNGPSGPVAVDFSAQMGADTTGAISSRSLQDSLNSINIFSVPGADTVFSLTDPITGPQEQSINKQLSLTVGQDYLVTLEAAAILENCCSTFPASASAFIDPMITIDPSTPDASAYSIAFSPNLTSTGAIPEPCTWVLLLAGFGGLGLMRRRSFSKRVVTAPAAR